MLDGDVIPPTGSRKSRSRAARAEEQQAAKQNSAEREAAQVLMMANSLAMRAAGADACMDMAPGGEYDAIHKNLALCLARVEALEKVEKWSAPFWLAVSASLWLWRVGDLYVRKHPPKPKAPKSPPPGPPPRDTGAFSPQVDEQAYYRPETGTNGVEPPDNLNALSHERVNDWRDKTSLN